jgi:predicted nucleic acid-binding protein
MADAPLIVDASVALKWLVEEAGSDSAEALRTERLAAPALIRIEVANVLRTLAARGAVSAAAAADRFRLFQTAPLTVMESDAALETRALAVALEIGHPVYDCLYLALAERLRTFLVTADGRFLRAIEHTELASHARHL